MRRVLIAACVLAGACGGHSPIAPSSTPPEPTTSLQTGSYLLTVMMSASAESGVSSCVSSTIGGGTPPAFVSVFVPTPVHLQRGANDVVISPDDPSATFRMQLQVSGANLSGTASGRYQSSATTVAVTGRTSGAAAALGTAGPGTASGFLDGAVSVEGMTCVNNGHRWTLTAR